MKYIIGARGSGKTTKLLCEAIKYLNENPDAVAIFVSPTKLLSNFTKEHSGVKNEKIIFTSWDEYLKNRYPYQSKCTKRSIFIEQGDYILRSMCDAPINAITFAEEEKE